VACRAHLGEVQQVWPAIQELGGRVLVINLTRPDQVAAFLRRHPLPFDVVCDPSTEAYRALGLGRASWWTFLRPGVIGRYLLALARGTRPAKLHEGDDLLQLGGDFVLDGRHQLVYAYRSRTPTDRPAATELLDAVRRAVGSAGEL
jgi:hypothetical protein